MRIDLDCSITVAMTTILCHMVKTRILYGFLLARSRPVVSLNTASNKVRADVAKKSFRVKLRVKVGTMTGCTVFSQKRRWIDLSAGQVYPGEEVSNLQRHSLTHHTTMVDI